MGLETSTYISGLTNTWPPSGDPKSQGDDHLRLIKTVLQNTFPAATGPMYFPKTEATSGTLVLDITDQNNLVMVTTTGGDVAVTLPSGFTTTNVGWSCEVVKVTADVNAAVVSPASGTIMSQAGTTATIRVGAYCQPAKFVWSGSTWICVKPGAPIGVTGNFDGPAPYGWLLLDGSVYSSTTYAELFAAYGSTTLRDKRGRVEAGVDGGAGRLTAAYFGTSPILNAVGGGESTTLSAAQSGSPAHQHNVYLTDPGHTHTFTPTLIYNANVGGNIAGGSGAGTTNPTVGSAVTGISIGSSPGTSTNSVAANAAAAASAAHSNVQHTIVTNKYIRAC